MVSVPQQITSETFAGLSLQPLVDELFASTEMAREGKTGRTLVKSPPLTMVLTVMRAGEKMHQHATSGPLIVVPIRGDVSFDHAGDSSRVSTDGDSVALVGAEMEHEVRAHTDSAFLLILGARD